MDRLKKRKEFFGKERFFVFPRKSFLRGLRAFAVIALGVSAFSGCKSKPKSIESKLPLPPTVDGGLVGGQFIQAEYGFAFPVPSKWDYLRLSPDQEVDEVARFTDPQRELILRAAVQILGASQKFTAKSWADLAGQDLKNHQFQLKKQGSSQEFKTADSGNWVMIPFQMVDSRGGEWMDEEWGLNQDDLLVIAHVTLPQDLADTEKGKKLLKAVENSLTQIHWYRPIGPRGISVDRYELQQFTQAFCHALESRSSSQVSAYFDDMYPERGQWNLWYQQAVSGDPKTFSLKAELSGLVINGDYATATFSLTRNDKGDSKPRKFERDFRLSKKEGTWKIMASLDKN
jgi:hypothetical protein